MHIEKKTELPLNLFQLVWCLPVIFLFSIKICILKGWLCHWRYRPLCALYMYNMHILLDKMPRVYFITPPPHLQKYDLVSTFEKKIPSVMNLNTPLLPDEWHIRGLLINKVNVYSASPFFQCQPGNGRKVTCLVRFWRFSIRVNDES